MPNPRTAAASLLLLPLLLAAPAQADVVDRLDKPELAGQRLIAGWSGTTPPRELKRMIRRGRVAGVILFADNIGGRRATARRIRRLQAIPRPPGLRDPLLVTVDQEGGLVKRVPGAPHASAKEIGRRGRDYAREQGRRTARNLRRWEINVNLAPVLDVARRGSNLDATDRSFGRKPRRVRRVGVDGFALGLRRHGIAPTAKHFPGIGMIETNTDFASQRVTLSKRRLRDFDQRPFEAFARDGGELVMLSLATYTAFAGRPAAFARKVVTGELRDRIGFKGVSITDALEAAAARNFGGRGKIARAAAAAGNDLLLYTDWRNARAAGRTLTKALRSGRLAEHGFRRSARRVLRLRGRL